MSALVTIGCWGVLLGCIALSELKDLLARPFEDRDRARHVRQMGAATRVTVEPDPALAVEWIEPEPDEWDEIWMCESWLQLPTREPQR